MASILPQSTDLIQKAKADIAAARDLAELKTALADLVGGIERVEDRSEDNIKETVKSR